MIVVGLILRRVALAFVVLGVVSLIVFWGTEVLPGDALEMSYPPQEYQMLSQAFLDQRRAELGLDRPPWVRYFEWAGRAFRFDFGETLIGQERVIGLIREPLLNSLILAAIAIALVPPVAIALGTIAALRPGGRLDNVISSLAITGYSVPEFVTGNVLILIFAVWFPVAAAVITLMSDASTLELLAVSGLPIATLLISATAYQLRIARAAMIDAMDSEAVERVRLLRLPRRRIVLHHALPIALVPTLSATAQFVAGVLSGLVVIEFVFNYPGIGVEMVAAVGTRDVALVQAIVLIVAAIVVVVNLAADLAIIALDPRVRRPAHA